MELRLLYGALSHHLNIDLSLQVFFISIEI